MTLEDSCNDLQFGMEKVYICTRLGHQNKCNISTSHSIVSLQSPHSLSLEIMPAIPFLILPNARCLQLCHKSSTESVPMAEPALLEHKLAHLFDHGFLLVAVTCSWPTTTATSTSLFLWTHPRTTSSTTTSLRTTVAPVMALPPPPCPPPILTLPLLQYFSYFGAVVFSWVVLEACVGATTQISPLISNTSYHFCLSTIQGSWCRMTCL